jgi:hypothetical protein
MPSNDQPQTRGILSKSDKTYLDDPDRYASENTRQSVNGRKTDIRDRVEAGIKDFSVLFEQWNEEERETVLGTQDQELDQGLVDMLALVYLETHLDGGRFDNLLMRAVNRAESRKAGSEMRYKTNFDPERVGPPPYDSAIDKFGRSGMRDMSDDEAHALVNLFRKTPTLSKSDLIDMRDTLSQQRDQALEEYEEAKIRSKEYEREKQGQKEAASRVSDDEN